MEQKNKKEKIQFKAQFPGLVDLVVQDGGPAFLILENGELNIQSSGLSDGIEFIPPPVDKIPFLLPRGEEVLTYYNQEKGGNNRKADAALFEVLENYFREVSELPFEELYSVLAAWTMHTYLFEKFNYTPVLWFHALPEKGKSRTGKALAYLSYRGTVTEDLNEAFIFRFSENFGCTIFFDVSDIWRKAERKNACDILLGRFEKGHLIHRVLNPEKGPFEDYRSFHIYGPTILASNNPVNPAMESRSIQINMGDSTKRFEIEITPRNVQSIKERLVSFRARHFNNSLPHILPPVGGRLADISKPLLQVASLASDEGLLAVRDFIVKHESSRRIEKSESLEAKVILTIQTLATKAIRGIIAVKDITDSINQELNGHREFSPQRIGRLLSSMGFEKTRGTKNGSSAIVLNDGLIDRLALSHGLQARE